MYCIFFDLGPYCYISFLSSRTRMSKDVEVTKEGFVNQMERPQNTPQFLRPVKYKNRTQHRSPYEHYYRLQCSHHFGERNENALRDFSSSHTETYRWETMIT